jgi:hypothetical protein
MRAPFVFGDDPRPLVTLLDSAGFGDVDVQARAGTVRFASVQAFVRCQRAASPLAAHVDVRHVPDLIAYVEARAAAEFPIEAAVASGEVRE